MARQATLFRPSMHRLRELLIYDPASGIILWKWNYRSDLIGRRAGNIRPDGRRRIKIDGRLYYANHVAWALFYGKWPDHEVDHKSRDSADDSICNLRAATPTQQCQNRAFRKNAVGHRGLRYQSSGNIAVQIQVNGKKISLGTFATYDEAVAVRLAAEKKFFGEFAPE